MHKKKAEKEKTRDTAENRRDKHYSKKEIKLKIIMINEYLSYISPRLPGDTPGAGVRTTCRSTDLTSGHFHLSKSESIEKVYGESG